MNFGNTTILQLSKAKMSYLGQRQAVLASNVANVDTPGYAAQEVKAPNFKKMISGQNMQSAAMTRTHAMHMGPTNGGGNLPVVTRRMLEEINPDGNGINLDTEIQKVAFTQAEYDQVVSIYRKNIALVRTAIGNRG